MLEKPVWRGVALGSVVIVLLAAVWFFSGRGRNDSGGVTDSNGRWQVPVPQPDAPEAPRWGSDLTSSPTSAQPGVGQATATAWDGWNSPSTAGPVAQTAAPSKSPLGFDLPPGNRWGDAAITDAGSPPTGMAAQQQYAPPGAALPVPSYAPQGVSAFASRPPAWNDPASSQPPLPAAQQPSWANAASNNFSETPSAGAGQPSVQDGQPYTVQNPYYQPWTGPQAVAQNSSGYANSTPSSGPTWAAPSSQTAAPTMPTTYPQGAYSQASAQSYGYPATPPYASPAVDERVAFRGNGRDSGSPDAGYVPAYSPNLNRPSAPSWNQNASPNSAYPAPSGEASGWGRPADPSLPASGGQPQVVDPAVVRADYARTSVPAATGYPVVPNPSNPTYTPAPSANSSPYYYPSTSGSPPVYPQTSTSTWNTYR